MAKDRLSGKLAVILHADIAGSTALVQRDEQLAHERIQDAFGRFSETIEKYQGHVQELRGDALLADVQKSWINFGFRHVIDTHTRSRPYWQSCQVSDSESGTCTR